MSTLHKLDISPHISPYLVYSRGALECTLHATVFSFRSDGGVYPRRLLTCSDNLRGVAPAPLQMLAVLLAAMVHDLGHDGCNNSFHCAANDEIAVRHAYSSPLERHHLASLFAILKEPA